MVEADTLEAIAADLRELAPRHRRAVLDALSAAERRRIAALLETPPAPEPAPAMAAVQFSPWLQARLALARDGAGERMTPAARHLLVRAAQDAIDGNLPPATAAPARAERSLLGALADALLPRRAAR